jgi:periplasmic protein TonB
MNGSKFALFVALLIHLVVMLAFWVLGSIIPPKEIPEPEKKIRISLKELPKKTPPTIKKKEPEVLGEVKELPKPIEIAPPMIKGSQLEKIVTRKTIQYEPEIKIKTPKLNPKEKQVQKIKPEPIIKEEIFIPLMKEEEKEIIEKEEPKKETPMNWLYEDKAKDEKPVTKREVSSATSSGKNIRELYGSKFGELSQAQQEYILDNQEIMRRITQQVLTRQASVSNLSGLNVNRTNVIEFYLHPNGDKTDFKFLSKSGYFILDEITRVTIEYAYSKYPRPKEKTLIRYNVFYNLKHY